MAIGRPPETNGTEPHDYAAPVTEAPHPSEYALDNTLPLTVGVDEIFLPENLPAVLEHIASRRAWEDKEVQVIANLILGRLHMQGEASRADLKQYMCGGGKKDTTPNLGVPQEIFTKAFSFLSGSLKMLTERTNEAGVKVWAIKRNYNRMLVEHITAIREDVKAGGKATKPKVIYSDWVLVEGYLTVTTPVYSSVPEFGVQGVLHFHPSEGKIALFDRYFGSMFRKAGLDLGEMDPEYQVTSNALWKCHWSTQFLDVEPVLASKPVPPDYPGAKGKGLTTVESLPPGTRIPFKVRFPRSHISSEAFCAILEYAGECVGLSPAAHHMGFGRFVPEIVSARPVSRLTGAALEEALIRAKQAQTEVENGDGDAGGATGD